ncbi:MAG: beta-eliminating lyase-related protein, partial [Thermodesulfobacteriota bacterium]
HNLAKRYGLAMHLDGARLMNASVALGIPPDSYAQYFDSVSICLSKGLGAPIGSVIGGTREFIRRAHRFRKMFGGGMRQVGIIAAAGIYALDHHIDRLALDHANAKKLAQGLFQIDGVKIDPNSVETNIVIFDASETGTDPHRIVEALGERGILMIPFGKTLIRSQPMSFQASTEARGVSPISIDELSTEMEDGSIRSHPDHGYGPNRKLHRAIHGARRKSFGLPSWPHENPMDFTPPRKHPSARSSP